MFSIGITIAAEMTQWHRVAILSKVQNGLDLVFVKCDYVIGLFFD